MTVSAARRARLGPAASARRAVAVSAGKAAQGGIRLLGRRTGTAIPGLVTLTIDPAALSGLVAELGHGAVIVGGSAGKGTTCQMLAQIMRAAGLSPVINHEGPGHRSGLATAMLEHCRLTGHVPGDAQAIGLFEVGERSFPEIVSDVPEPRVIVFTNIFRDRLDRYFEPAYVRALLERSLRSVPAEAALVLNADDPRVAYLAADLSNPRFYFGIADPELGRDETDPTSDFPRCPRCDGELSYSCVYYAHLGHWSCAACGLTRPEPDLAAAKVDLVGPSSTRLQVATEVAESVLEIPLPGVYNAYNALAAFAAASCCQLPDRSFSAIEQVKAGCLRMERLRVDGHDVCLALANNASGYTEVLRAVLSDGRPRRMLLGLGDFAGMQPDTSWIWDIDFDSLAGLVPAPVITGNRAADLAVRLKYAGWGDGGTGSGQNRGPAGSLAIEPDPVRGFQAALAAVPAGQPLWVVSTEMVLRQLRCWLRQQGHISERQPEPSGAAPCPA
jgi:lipid II isoglutaminyl synthase (glutamine-hydrolysing)